MSHSCWHAYVSALRKSCPRLPKLKQAMGGSVAALVLCTTIVTPAFADHAVSYQVQPGDTLLAIAQQDGVSVATIAALNALPNPNRLIVGETITIKPTDTVSVSVPVLTMDPLPVTPNDPYFPHFPSFTIDPNGLVVRTLSHVPLPTPPPAILSAPYFNQFDGTIWGPSNCGPTTLAMALGAVGVKADQLALRTLTDRQMGIHDPNNGTTWESLAYAAQQSGVSTDGLYKSGQSYRTWTLDDLKNELSLGRPVMLLVRYWDLPDHIGSSFAGDHYIVALGFDENGNLVYNDSASSNGAHRTISPSQLMKAWSEPAVGLVRTAMAFYR